MAILRNAPADGRLFGGGPSLAGDAAYVRDVIASMLAWPEAALLAQRRVAPAPGEFYVRLSLTLVTGTVIMTALVAAAVDLTRAGAHRP